GRFHHIFDPHTGASANTLADAAVIGPRATAANGLATAICVAGEERAAALLAAYPGTRAICTRPDGTSVTIAPAEKLAATRAGGGAALQHDPGGDGELVAPPSTCPRRDVAVCGRKRRGARKRRAG